LINVIIVGLGRIGALYPDAEEGIPRSHLSAIFKDQRYEISGLVENDNKNLAKVQNHWPSLIKTPIFSSLYDIPAECNVDLIVICTPPEHHLEAVKAAILIHPKLILVEKPLALEKDTAEKIAVLAEEAEVTIRINFHRRFDREYRQLKENIVGNPIKLVMYYNKGLFNYASHLVDFLLDWFGPVESVQALDKEVNPSFCCRMAAGFDAIIVGLDDLEYDQFEVKLIYQDRRIELANGGCQKRIQKPVEGLFYPGYSQLGPAIEIGTDGPVGGLVELYEAAAKYTEGGEEMPGCDAAQACQGLAVLEAVEASVISGRRERPVLHHL